MIVSPLLPIKKALSFLCDDTIKKPAYFGLILKLNDSSSSTYAESMLCVLFPSNSLNQIILPAEFVSFPLITISSAPAFGVFLQLTKTTVTRINKNHTIVFFTFFIIVQ